MPISRRLFLASSASVCASVFAPSVFAKTWPSRPINLMVAYGPGSPPDVVARLFSAPLDKELGSAVVVQNKPGASGNLASAEVARSKGDGYTFLYTVSSAFTVNPYVYTEMPFNAEKDLVPVGTTMIQGYVLVANNNFKANTLPELIALAQQDKGKLTYGSWGLGSYSHLLMERVLDDTKAEMLHVPYKSAPLNAVIGGEVDVLVEPLSSAAQYIATGKIKALAYTGNARHPGLPSIPTVAEMLPGITLHSWHGIWAPASTSTEIVRRLNTAMMKVSKDPRVLKTIKTLECDPLAVSPAEMTRMIAEEAEIYSKLVKEKNIKLG